MHFRFRGNSIQVIRSQIDAESGKAKSVPIGSINRATLGITDNLRGNCSPEELREIEAWVGRYQAVDDLKRKHAALTLPEQLGAAALWLEAASAEEVRELVDDIVSGINGVRKAFAKHGLI